MFDKIREDAREVLTGSTPENDLRARLHADHTEVSKLLQELLSTGDEEISLREDLRDEIVGQLTAHARAEEEVVYSRLLGSAELQEDERHAEQEHQRIDQHVRMLQVLDASDPELVDAARQLQAVVDHHVREEETRVLPRAERELGQAALAALIPDFNRRKSELLDELLPEHSLRWDLAPTGSGDVLSESDSRY